MTEYYNEELERKVQLYKYEESMKLESARADLRTQITSETLHNRAMAAIQQSNGVAH